MAIIKAKVFHAFRVAVLEGRLDSVKLLWEAADADLQKTLFTAKDYLHFHLALKRHQVKVIEFLWSVANDEQRTWILEKLLKNQDDSPPRDWSIIELSKNSTAYADIVKIMEDKASPHQLTIIKQFYRYNYLTSSPRMFTPKGELKTIVPDSIEESSSFRPTGFA